MGFYSSIRRYLGLIRLRNKVKSRGREKVFCIGMNKTGTTSLKVALSEVGYIVGNQAEAEAMYESIYSGNLNDFYRYVERAEAFQDFPFSSTNIYQSLYELYPEAKFILTIRESSEEWYNSLVSFHSKRFGFGETPTKAQLQESDYIAKGAAWTMFSHTFNIKESSSNIYDKELLIAKYETHNKEVVSFFLNKGNLLVLNLKEIGAYQRFCEYLGVESIKNSFPWENKT